MLRAPETVQLLVDTHKLLDGVDINPCVLCVYARYPVIVGVDAVVLADTDNVDEVAEDGVENKLLVALVMKEVRADLAVTQGDVQTGFQSDLHLTRNFVQVYPV